MKLLPIALRILADLVLLAAFAGTAWWLGATVAGRLAHPFDLEWMEGGMLLHALRVRDGLPLYVAPSPEFIPYIYPPGYPWLVGMLGRVVPLGYPLARAVSIAGTVAAALLLILALRREGLRWSLGLGCAALFLSCYEDSGAFFDLIRTDGMQVALMAGALLLCRHGSRSALAAGGLVLAAAFATKHNMALLGLPIALALWRVHGWRRAAWFAAWSAVPALAWVAWVQLRSDGYFLTYLLAIPATHPIVGERLFPRAEKELFLAFPWTQGLAALPLLLALAGHAWRRMRRRAATPAPVPPTEARYRRWFWVGAIGTGLAMVVLMRGHHGGYVNVLIPGFWLLALAVGLGVHALLARASAPLARAALLLGAALVFAWQCWDGRWDRAKYTPTQADLDAGRKVLDLIASYDGPVLMPHSPYYPVMVGKAPSFALIALWDITHKRSPLRKEARVIDRAIRAQRFDAIILASRKFEYGLDAAYEQTRAVGLKGKALFPKSGWRARPSFVYEPRAELKPLVEDTEQEPGGADGTGEEP